jgi:hypothetical protein
MRRVVRRAGGLLLALAACSTSPSPSPSASPSAAPPAVAGERRDLTELGVWVRVPARLGAARMEVTDQGPSGKVATFVIDGAPPAHVMLRRLAGNCPAVPVADPSPAALHRVLEVRTHAEAWAALAWVSTRRGSNEVTGCHQATQVSCSGRAYADQDLGSALLELCASVMAL